jgi:UDP-glucose 4-epimerase
VIEGVTIGAGAGGSYIGSHMVHGLVDAGEGVVVGARHR